MLDNEVSRARPSGVLRRKSNGRIGRDTGDPRAKLRGTDKMGGMFETEPAVSGRPFSGATAETVGSNPDRFVGVVAPLRSDGFLVVL